MGYIHGNDLIISLNGIAIAAAKSCDIHTNCDLKEISSPNSSDYREYKAGRKAWRVSVNYLVNTNDLGALTVRNIGITYTINAHVRNNQGLESIQGQAILQEANISSATGSLLKGNWIFQGTGILESNSPQSIFYGAGLSYTDATTEASSTTDPSGTYLINVSADGMYVWFVLPAAMTIHRATMGGFDFPLESPQIVLIDNVNYKAYRSINTYDEGSMTIVLE